MSVLYLAYGANMHPAGMALRCPGAEAEGVCRLPGWRFVIQRHGYANLVRAPGRTAYGVLWRLSAAHLASLDAFENVEAGLYRRAAISVTLAGRRRRALIYLSSWTEIGMPAFGYLDRVVLPAARHWDLPQRYIEEIGRWAMPKRRKRAVPSAS